MYVVTYLYGLAWAANIAGDFTRLQTDRFRMAKDPSTRCLPALIPLIVTNKELPTAELDAVRRTHTVSCGGFEGRGIPAPSRIDLSSDRTMVADLARLQDALLARLDDDSAVSTAIDLGDGRPCVRLAWRDHDTSASPIRIPATEAFWLAAYRIAIRRPDRQWWTNIEWQEMFSRRVSQASRR